MMALEGLVLCESCQEPTPVYKGENFSWTDNLCERCYDEWLAGELRDEDDE